MKIEDIKRVYVHWSESEHINKVLGSDDSGDINKVVDKYAFHAIVNQAAKEVGMGYDKTALTVAMNDGTIHDEIKFYLTVKKDSLIKLIENDV